MVRHPGRAPPLRHHHPPPRHRPRPPLALPILRQAARLLAPRLRPLRHRLPDPLLHAHHQHGQLRRHGADSPVRRPARDPRLLPALGRGAAEATARHVGPVLGAEFAAAVS